MKNTVEILCLGDIQFERQISIDPLLTTLLAKADIVFGNLETPISDRGSPANKVVTLRTNPAYASELQKLGLKVVTLANNHILDFGPEAMFDTLSLLAKQNIRYVGVGENLKKAASPVVFDVGPLRIGFLGVACTLPSDFAANEFKLGVAPLRVRTYVRIDPAIEQEQPGTPPFIYTEPDAYDLDYFIHIVKEVKKEVDYVIVGIHWGVPFQNNVLDYQVKIAETLTGNGVDFLVGHHPHTLHGIASMNNKIVFYSLGNFVFHHKPRPELVKKFSKIMGRMEGSPYSAVARLLVSESEMETELIPVMLDEKGDPRLANLDEAEKILVHLQSLSSENGCKLKMFDGVVRVIVK
ncbi:MAG: CapA family protein [Candidatus Caldarchaeum sp.]